MDEGYLSHTFTSELSYHRSSEVGVGDYSCDKCNTDTLVLCVDTSEGEYGFVYLCHNCINQMFLEANDRLGANEEVRLQTIRGEE